MINQVAEAVHQENGDVSHGNRIGHSASTAVRQIYDNIKAMSEGYTRTCYVATMDVSGFFMSIDKEVAYRVFEYYAHRTGVVDMEKLNETIRGVKITDNGNGSFAYEELEVEIRNYSDYMYYGPIPHSEILKWSNLKQNKGW